MKPLAFALFVSAILPTCAEVALVNGFFDVDTGVNIGRPSGWTGSNLFRVLSDTNGINEDATNKYVIVRGTGDATISQTGTIDLGTEGISLTGWFFGNGTGDDQATITLSVLDESAAVLDSVTLSSGDTAGWQQINGANGLYLAVGSAVTWEVTLFYDNVLSNYASSKFDDLTLTADSGPAPQSLLVLSSGFNGNAFELTVSGFNTVGQYVLKRSNDLQTFEPVGSEFTPTTET